MSTIKSGRGTQPDDAAATGRDGTVLTLGSMEVIAVAEDKFWLHDGASVPPGAEQYHGPPPIPLDELRRNLPSGWTAERAWRYSADEQGRIGVMPITIVTSPDGDRLQFFPRSTRHRADASAASRGRLRREGR